MKKIHLKSFLFTGLLAMGLATPALAEIKIGVVNVVKLMEASPKAKQAQESLKKEFSTAKRDLETGQATLKKLSERYQRDQAVMSSTERSKLEQEMRTKQREMMMLEQDTREKAQRRNAEEMNKISEQIRQVVVKVAEKEGYDLVLYDGVMHASDQIDLTGLVEAELRKQ